MKTNGRIDGMNGIFFGFPPELIRYGLMAVAVLQLTVTIVLALAVSTDAAKRKSQPAGLFLAGPWTWFFSGLLTAAIWEHSAIG